MIQACYFPLMPRFASPVGLTETDRLELERWVAAHRTPQQVAQRCQIVLAASRGHPDKDIATDLEINFKTAALWRKRFINEGPDCLWEVAEGTWTQANLNAARYRKDCGCDAPNQTCGGNTLELPDHGQSPRREQSHRESDLAKPSNQTASDQRIQTFAGSEFLAEANRCR